jgi:hypothetical protein
VKRRDISKLVSGKDAFQELEILVRGTAILAKRFSERREVVLPGHVFVVTK